MTTPKAPRGFTYAPCPACGKSEYLRPRPKDGICSTCRAILDAHAKRVSELGDKNANEVAYFAVPTRSHWLPYISHQGSSDNIRTAFLKLAQTMSEPCSAWPAPENRSNLFKEMKPTGYGWSGHAIEDFRQMSPSVASAISTLFDVVRTGIDCAYDKGKADGTNLLAMLQAGELTSNEFERRAGMIKD